MWIFVLFRFVSTYAFKRCDDNVETSNRIELVQLWCCANAESEVHFWHHYWPSDHGLYDTKIRSPRMCNFPPLFISSHLYFLLKPGIYDLRTQHDNYEWDFVRNMWTFSLTCKIYQLLEWMQSGFTTKWEKAIRESLTELFYLNCVFSPDAHSKHTS